MRSSVAGIVDRNGGIRVVVTRPELLLCHVGIGEQLFVIPDLLVDEPVPLDEAPVLIDRVLRYVAENR